MNRIKEISIYSVILTILVVCIHLMSEPVSYYSIGSAMHFIFFISQKAISFVVPAFIFLSGLRLFISLENKKEFSYKEFILRRFTKILLPYLIFVNIYYAYFRIRGFIDPSFNTYLEGVLLGKMASHFYFIIIILQFYLIIPFIINYCKKIDYKVGILIAIIFTGIIKYFVPLLGESIYLPIFNYSDRIFLFYFCYFIMGAYAGMNYEAFLQALNKNIKILIALFLIISISHISFSYIQATGHYAYRFAEIVHMFFCIISTLTLYCLSKKFSDIGYINKICTELDSVSIYIYFLHPLIIYIVNNGFYLLNISRISERFIFRVPLVFFITIALCFISKIIATLKAKT